MDESGVHVVVARARIDGEPAIELIDPTPVTARPGQKVHVKFLYRVEETSRSKEAWTFGLKSSLGRFVRGPQLSRWRDRFALKDDLWGEICHEYTFDQPGAYEGDFQVTAEYQQGRWTGHEANQTRQRNARGRVRVLVE